MNFEASIKRIEDELRKPLPGEEHQLLMAPEFLRLPDAGLAARKAAVLICLIMGKTDLQVVFIKRTEYDGPHSGQISFPGGIFEDGDYNMADTAFRETREETGLDSEKARLLGALTNLHIPVSNITVHPYVAFYETDPVFTIDKNEVSYIFLVALRSFFDPGNYKKEVWDLSGRQVNVPFFHLNDNKIWGATAMILSEFLEVIRNSGIYD